MGVEPSFYVDRDTYIPCWPHTSEGGGGGMIMENFSSKVLIKKSRKGGEKDREKL